MKVELGSTVRDKISGFSGVACVLAEYLDGYRRVLIEPNCLNENNEPLEGFWFDEGRLEIVNYPALKCEACKASLVF